MKIPFLIIFVARWDASESTWVSQETQVRFAPTSVIQWAVPENIHTPLTEGIGISRGQGVGGAGGFCKTKKFKEMYMFEA